MILGGIIYSPTSGGGGTSLAVTADPTSVFEEVSSASGVASASIVATPTGGSGSYTYLWTIISGGTGLTLTGTTSDTVGFNYSGLDTLGSEISATVRCTVTDTFSATAFVNVGVFLLRSS